MIFDRYKAIGYRPQLFLVNAADCGVPQQRERVFFCALRNDINRPKLVLAPQHRWISAGEAVSDLGTDLADFYLVTAGNERHVLAFRYPVHDVHSNPSFTLTGTNNTIDLITKDRKTKKRVWSFQEYKRLGSFPDDYKAKTDKIGKYMIGMSVPPKMTEVVANAVIEQWL
jgi:DNA (cytosine-5)-methyltransferase 1